MTHISPLRWAFALAGLLAASPVLAQDAGDATAGATVFKKCKSCHQVGEGAKNGIGPELNNVMGRQIGSVPGFKYSKALQPTGEVWDATSLGAFLANPKTARPGSKMTFAGLKSEADIADVLAYLASASGS